MSFFGNGRSLDYGEAFTSCIAHVVYPSVLPYFREELTGTKE